MLNLSALPVIPGVEKLAAQKHFRTRASKTNAEYVAGGLKIEGKVDPIRLEIFHDAQTSGGLLISVDPAKADALVAALKRHNAAAVAVIGEVQARGEGVAGAAALRWFEKHRSYAVGSGAAHAAQRSKRRHPTAYSAALRARLRHSPTA